MPEESVHLTIPDTRCPTPTHRTPRKTKVITIISLALAVCVELPTFTCVICWHYNCRGGRMCILKVCCGGHVQSRLHSVGLVQRVGKENVNPGVDPTHCSQIPVAQLKTSVKRTRKQGLRLAVAEGVDTAPRTPRICRSKKVAKAALPLVDLMLQTPMPLSPVRNGAGPPPPDTTPAPNRECRLSLCSPAFPITVLHCRLV